MACCLLLVSAVTIAAEDAASPLLTPAPREIAWTGNPMELKDGTVLVTGGAEAQIGRVLTAEMARLHGVRLVPGESGDGPQIVLALADTPRGQAAIKEASWAKWPPARNAEEGYLLEVSPKQATIVAATPRGLLYGCQTLVQLAEPTAGSGKQLRGARVVDYPQLAFRGVHICIFPNTELPAVRQAILVAARYKCNAVVLEFWSSLQSKSHPETAYEHAYTPDEIRPLVQLGRALQMEMIPMLNSWGHASGMRSRSREHAVLDRHPEFKPLFEPDGWSFCLTNPDVLPHLFDRYDELLELFGPVKYFHVGLDEAWGHLGKVNADGCRGDNPRETLQQHLAKICDYFAQRKIQVLMWHDMFLERNHPQLGRVSPANSTPPFNTHLILDQLPKDVIMAAWNYDDVNWPVPKYFHDKGFPVVVCPWKARANTVSLLEAAKKDDLMGVLETTWDSLDVALPSVAQACVLGWTAPGYDLKQIPFDHWVVEIRKLPICQLPNLEKTLEP
jgi:hypothetical protein